MKPPEHHEAKTFGDWGYVAIAKHSRKILKHEAGVFKDKDPEELHQMRVGMRRLRSAIAGFEPAIALPPEAREQKVGKVAKILGKLRDLDVLGEALETQYKPALPPKEQKELNQALKALKKGRDGELEQVKATLEGKIYKSLKQALADWLEQPQYRDIGGLSLQIVLPDLLLPQMSKLLLHPGWFVGVEMTGEDIKVSEAVDAKTIEKILENNAETLHDLRKEAKRSRYQMELFTPFYRGDYVDRVQEIKEIQQILGDIQDSFVLAEFLAKTLDENIDKSMPTLVEQLRQTRYQKWQAWQSLQKNFLNLQRRHDLRLTVQKPELEIQSAEDE
jgi:CHAD domain-containing protein